jgi:hypothetical protein
MAGGDAGLAARAGIEVDLEGVLLAGARRLERDQVAVDRRRRAGRTLVVGAGKTDDGRGELLLFGQELGGERPRQYTSRA